MTQYRNLQASFTTGLLSPLQEGAVGTTAYASGLSVAENVYFGLSGGVFKRNGTRFGAIALADSVAYSFISGGEVYLVEFGDKTARLLDADGNVVGNPVTTQYAKAEVSQLCCNAFLDELYITHRNHPPATMAIQDGQLTPPEDIEFVAPQSNTATEGTDRTVCKTFSEEGDYPALNIFYGGRWYLHSTDNEPLTIWASRTIDSTTGEYRMNDFTLEIYAWVPDGEGGGHEEQTLLADLAFTYLSTNMYGTNPRWMMAHQCLLIGTARALFKDSGSSAVTATGDSPFSLSTATEYGTRGTKAVAIGSYIFFPGTNGKSLLCAAYDQQYSSYAAAEISSPVSRYLKGGIKRLAAVTTPTPLIFVLTEDGNLLCCYFVAGSIVAWSVFTFTGDDKPLWVEDIQGGNSGEARILLIMQRGTQRTLETLEIVPSDSIWEEPHLDCYTVDSASPLTGREITIVDVSFDGSLHRYSLGDEASTKSEVTRYRGLAYTSVIGNMRAELPANGTSQSTMRSVKSVVVRLYKSFGGTVCPRPDLDNSEKLFVKDDELADETILYSRFGKKEYGEDNPLYTGEVTVNYAKSNLLDDRLIIRSQDPFPFCLTALIVNYTSSEV